MRFTIAAAAALVAGAAAADYDYGYANTTSAVVDYATTVVSEYITYCPSPTEITYGDKTYTVTEVSRRAATLAVAREETRANFLFSGHHSHHHGRPLHRRPPRHHVSCL